MSFVLLPAIDLRAGRVVRLLRGDFAAETIYAGEPASVAESFVAAGATALHVVDLDAARSGDPAGAEAVPAVVAAVGEHALVEVAGGIRTLERAAALLRTGAGRVVVGTAAIADPTFAGRLVERHGSGAIAVALDVRGGRAVGHGWRQGTAGRPVLEVIAELSDVGVATFEVTAIERDGTLSGPDLALLERCVRAVGAGHTVIASAGITTVLDIRRVRELGCSGAIVGRAFYEGRLAIAEALAAARGD